MLKRLILMICVVFTLTAVFGCSGAETAETSPSKTTEAAQTTLLTTEPSAIEPTQVELILSPNPAFVRVGNLVNIAVTEKYDYSKFALNELISFTYHSPAEFNWTEDSNGTIITFEEPGVIRGLSPGNARVSINKNGIQGNSNYPSIEVQVLPAIDIPASSDKEVVAVYFPWFSERCPQPPPKSTNCEGWSIYTPTLKPYDPQSKEVAEQHIRMAKDAGIDAFAISWFSPRTWSDYNIYFKPAIDSLISLASQLDFRIYITYESQMNLCPWEEGGWIPLESEAAREKAKIDAETDFIYLLEQLSVIEDSPAFFLYCGAAIGLSPEDWRHVIEKVKKQYPQARFYCDTGNVEYLIAFNGLFLSPASFYEDLLNEYPRNVEEVKRFSSEKQFYACVSPGFDATLFWDPNSMIIPREDGEYYRHTWEKALVAHPDGIIVNSWNEWGETTYIEPSKEYGYQYIDITAEYAIIFKSGNEKNLYKDTLTSYHVYDNIIFALCRRALFAP